MVKYNYTWIALFIVFIVDFTLLIYIHNRWHESMSKYIPIQQKISLRKAQIADAHTALEEYIFAKKNIDIEVEVLEHFKVAKYKKLLEKIEIEFKDIDEKEIIAQIRDIQDNMEDIHQLATIRIDNILQDLDTKVLLDNQFNDEFKKINNKIDTALKIINKKLNKSLQANELMFKVVMAFFIIINIFIFIIIYIFDKRNIKLQKDLDYEKDKALVTLKSIGDGVIITDIYGKVTFLNSIAQNITGFCESEAIGKDLDIIFNIISVKTKEKIDSPVKKVLQTDSIVELSNGTALIAKNKKEYIISDSASPIKDEKGKTLGVVLVFKDDTEKHNLKDEIQKQETVLSHQSKMAAMGEMLENIAHQWRQPLSVIATSISGIRLQKEFEMLSDEFLYETIDLVVDSTEYLSKTLDDFRNFFSIEKEKEEFDISYVINNAIIFTSPSFQYDKIEVISKIEEIKTFGYKNELIHVLVSILQNAKDAFEDRKKNKDKKFVFIRAKKLDEKTIQIKIKDNAGGIPEKIIDRVFEPYFTTKHQSRGTGIGLYMALQMVKKHMEGEISVENQKFSYKDKKYKGACFTLNLPIVDK